MDRPPIEKFEEMVKTDRQRYYDAEGLLQAPVSDEQLLTLCTYARQLEQRVRKLEAACIQARGALRLDHMVDDDGKPFGTTTVALEAIDAALADAGEGLTT